MRDTSCPCHTNRPYAACCERLHRGAAATDAVALMRSRYSAYALGNVAYIVATTSKTGDAWEKDGKAWRRNIAAFCREHCFVGLTIDAEASAAATAWVLFTAVLQRGALRHDVTERSRFVVHRGRWLYVGRLPNL